MRIVFDIETNGMRNQPHRWGKKWRENPPPIADTLHCLCLTESGSGVIEEYHDDPAIRRTGTVQAGLDRLSKATVLVGHNIIRYDLPVLKDLVGWEPSEGTIFNDTLVMSNLGYTSLWNKDARIRGALPEGLFGSHSLRAWGYRIGRHKSAVNDTENFEVFDEEMLTYCARDVEVNDALYRMFRTSWADSIPEAVEFEHEFFVALETQMDEGFHLDQEKAWSLVRAINKERDRLEDELTAMFPPRVVPATHIKTDDGWVTNPEADEPNAYWNPKGLKTKAKLHPFKPGSSMQVIWNLNKKYGWKPKKFTKSGAPAFTAEVIASIPHPETRDMVRYSQLCARLSELCGNSGYLTLAGEDGRVHGRIDHNAAVTHRCTHKEPNVGNVTGETNTEGVPQLYGKEMRELFSVPDDTYVIVGADASGLELRTLGDALAPFDGGDYAREVVDGDAHSRNADAQQLGQFLKQRVGEEDSAYARRLRTASKPITYAHNYGGGHRLLGEKAMPDDEEWGDSKCKRIGKRIKENMLSGLTGLKPLIRSLDKPWFPGMMITGLDGRKAESRSNRQGLNTKLQMNGAIIVKYATVLVHRWARERWGPPAKDGLWCMVAHVHDEYQFQAKKEIADELGQLACEAFRRAGELLSVTCRLGGEYSIGRSWAETH